jgi:hypothetical protein
MALFDFFKKKESVGNKSDKILLAMPIFKNNESYDLLNLLDDLKSQWGFDVTDIDDKDDVAGFKVNGFELALAKMQMQIPGGDIEGTAEYAYNWPSAVEDLKDHTGHALVTVWGGVGSPMTRHLVLSKVLCSILTTSNAVAIYHGTQSLLIPKKQYLQYNDLLAAKETPVPLWVYIGLIKSATGNSAYTYGLKEFNKQELEIIDSKLDLEDLYDFLGNIIAYILDNDVTLKSGETLGSSADEKISITASKGKFVDGVTLKLGVK